jgi:hypothetical protein
VGKKKPVVDLTDRELDFMIGDTVAKLIAFDPNTMTLQVNLHEAGQPVKTDRVFPFAHLPKALKKTIKPN